jgi:hypothetical protein
MFQAYVLNVSDFLRLILQVFHIDVAKVDLDVAYVAMTIYTHVFKSMFQVYVLNVLSILGVCCNCCCKS